MSSVHENPKFREFIRNLLDDQAELTKEYIDLLTDEKSMQEFTKSFTHKSIDLIHNYEYYETLGDVTTNKIVVWYYHRRFQDIFEKGIEGPKGGNMGPVAIMARLKQVGISKRTYAKFSDKLNFWDYIRVSEDEEKSRTKILEDVFEAFIGCLEYLIDMKVMEHSGYGIAYIFMSKIMDKEFISVDYESLYDQKSKLNEDINVFRKALKLEYVTIDLAKQDPNYLDDKNNVTKRFISHVEIIDLRNSKKYTFKSGYGANKAHAEQLAAKNVREDNIFKQLQRTVVPHHS